MVRCNKLILNRRAGAIVVDNHSVSIYKIKKIDQDAFLDAYNNITREKSLKSFLFYDSAEYETCLNEYCSVFYIDTVDHVLVLDINVGQDANYDLIDLQYLVELVMKLNKLKKYELVLLYFRTDNSNYFRISQMLRLWYIFHAPKNSVWFRLLDETGPKKLVRLAVNVSSSASKVLPLCQLSPKMWSMLSNVGIASVEECKLIETFFALFSVLSEKVDFSQSQILNDMKLKYDTYLDEEELYRLLISNYVISRISEYYNDYDKSDCLTLFIFALYINNMNKPSKAVNSKELVVIHEISKSFSQGILQLIENALIHPPKESEPYSFFSFRANNHVERLKKYIDNAEEIDALLEFSVSDIALNELYSKGITASFVQKHPECDSVSLSDFYDFTYADRLNVLHAYYSKPNNAVNHFGLQIFANVVLANRGCFNVTSLDKSNNTDHYFIADSSNKYNDVRNRCFSGTTYSVILPIEKNVMPTINIKNYVGNIPLLSVKNTFENGFSVFTVYENPLIISDEHLTLTNRDERINGYLDNLNLAYDLWGKPKNYCIQLNYEKRSSIVTFCKVIFSNLLTNSSVSNVVVFCSNTGDYIEAVRACCLFYDRIGRCNILNSSKGLLLYNSEEKTQIYFCGENLDTTISGLANQYLNGFISENIKNQIEIVFGSQLANVNHIENFISDIPLKLSVENPESKIKLLEEELTEILNRDIHDNRIGCKIANTHFRLSKVHLDTYYEAQFLFGNSYWCMAFAAYLANKIKESVINSAGNIIIYGYEKYSAETLSITKDLLKNSYNSVELLFYENGDPELDPDRVRFFKLLKGKEHYVIYFVGISSTLSTFKKMNQALEVAKAKYNPSIVLNKISCISIVQLIDSRDKSISGLKLLNDNSVQSNNIDFLDNNNFATFMVKVSAEWYKPEDCKYCHTGSYSELDKLPEERMLIEVDETSVIPTLLYKPKKEPVFNNITTTRTGNYLYSLKHEEFVYADHLKRKENHYQYYFRLARIYTTHWNEIETWLKTILIDPLFLAWREKISIDDAVNVIVSPQQNSNNGFVYDVNRIIFGGGAHTIVFDVRKEYRKTFIAKYEYLTESLANKKINFFYVADHIITGKTFYRTRSLIDSLFPDRRQTINGIFVLLNRSSLRSKIALLDNAKDSGYLPFFSFINISIPSLRSHSCPTCKLLSQFESSLMISASSAVALEYQRKILNNKVKTLKEIHDDYDELKEEKKARFIYNAEKLLVENELWEAFSMSSTNTKDSFISAISKIFSRSLSLSKRIKKLGIMLDTIISPMLIYQEHVKKVSFELVSCLFDEIISFLNSNRNGDTFEKFRIDLALAEKKDVVYLLEKTIWGLCYLGSSRLLFFENIKLCLEIGDLCDEEKYQYEKRIISYIKFLVSNDRIKEFSFSLDGELLENESSGAKSQVLIDDLRKYIGTDDWNDNSAFWELLYIECVSADTISLKKYINNKANCRYTHVNTKLDRLPPQYVEYINAIINNQHIKGSSIELLVKVDNCYCNLETFSEEQISETCKKSFKNNGFYYDSDQNEWFFPVTNNITVLEKDGKSKQSILELFGSTLVDAVVKIKPCGDSYLKQIESVRRIMLYRYRLLKMLEEDYEEEFFSRSYKLAIMMNTTRKILGTHGDNNWNDYQSVLECIHHHLNDSDKDKDVFFTVMNLYRNALISFANQAALLNLGIDDTSFRYNSTHPIDDALTIVERVVEFFKIEFDLSINYSCEFDCADEKQYEYIMFGHSTSVGYFTLGAFAYIFLENAKSHANTEKPIDISIEKCDDSGKNFKMRVSNFIDPNDENYSAVTVTGLTRLFEIIRNGNNSLNPEIKVDDGEPDIEKYTIELTNIIKEATKNEGSCYNREH